MYVICLYYCKYGGVDQLKEKSSQLKSCSNSIHYNFLFINNLLFKKSTFMLRSHVHLMRIEFASDANRIR